MKKKKDRYIWYCAAVAGLNKKTFPRFNTVKEAEADIMKKGGCSPVCEEEIIIYDLLKDKAIKKIFYMGNLNERKN